MKRVIIVLILLVGLLFCLSKCSSCSTHPIAEVVSSSSTSSDHDDTEQKNAEFSAKVLEAISAGNYSEAYAIVDGKVYGGKQCELNDKILKAEIAALIDKDENGSSAPAIISAILERAKYNDDLSFHEKESTIKVFSSTIIVAEAKGNTTLVNKLKKALKTYEDSSKESSY